MPLKSCGLVIGRERQRRLIQAMLAGSQNVDHTS